jgi:two-component system, NarL family, response regulator DevR
VVGEAAGVAEAITVARETRPDVVLLDIRLKDGLGFDACGAIRRENPHTKVVMLTSHLGEDWVRRALDAGASGYLLKEINSPWIVDALRSVHGGNRFIDPAVAANLVLPQHGGASGAPSDSFEARMASLSVQENRVLALVAEGLTNREIGERLNLSEKTVKNYLSNLLDKLELRRRSEAAAHYTKYRLSQGDGI